MRKYDFAQSLYSISRSFRQTFGRMVSDDDLTLAQWRALSYLSRNDMCRQVDLANLLEIKPITLARVIDKLEELGLVDRVLDKTDRRVFRLTLTTKAAPVIKRMRELINSVQEQALDGLDEKDRAVLVKYMIKIVDNLNRSEDK